MLAAQMHARGWSAYLHAPADRLASLVVQDPPDDRTMGSGIVAAPGGGAIAEWWYWFSWGERIAPVHAPGAAADAVISALREPPALP